MTTTASATSTVAVACKMPNGIILRLFDMEDVDVPVMGGGVKTVKQGVERAGAQFTLKGPAIRFGEVPDHRIVGGYGVTHVDAEFMKAWFAQNRDTDLVKNKMVFYNDKTDSLISRAKEMADHRSNLEPMNPDLSKETRRPRVGNPNLSAVVKADTKDAA